MRFLRFVALCAATFTVSSVATAAPLITAFIGTPSPTTKQAFFVLDFNDTGANPETYAFGWNYEPTKTAADFPVALASALTGANGFVQTGAASNFVTRYGYNGRVKDSATEPFGYWSLWLGFDSATWVGSQFGARDVTLSDTPQFSINPFSGTSELSSAKWTGWRWVNDFRTDSSTAPRTPQIAAVVPEAGTLTLAVLGLAGCGTVIMRRRKR